MSTLKFSDGMEIDTGGNYRVVRKSDGLYVVGHGTCVPVSDRREGEELVKQLSRPGRE